MVPPPCCDADATVSDGAPGAAATTHMEDVHQSWPYEAYTLRDWRRIEHQVWERRQVPISANKPARASRFRRGDNGPLYHPRRGLVGALQDWAEGSKADAAKIVAMLVRELELQVLSSTPNTTRFSLKHAHPAFARRSHV